MMSLSAKSKNGPAKEVELDGHFDSGCWVNHRHQFVGRENSVRVGAEIAHREKIVVANYKGCQI